MIMLRPNLPPRLACPATETAAPAPTAGTGARGLIKVWSGHAAALAPAHASLPAAIASAVTGPDRQRSPSAAKRRFREGRCNEPPSQGSQRWIERPPARRRRKPQYRPDHRYPWTQRGQSEYAEFANRVPQVQMALSCRHPARVLRSAVLRLASCSATAALGLTRSRGSARWPQATRAGGSGAGDAVSPGMELIGQRPDHGPLPASFGLSIS